MDWSVHRNTVRGKQSTKWIKLKITLIILNDLIAFPISPNKQRRFWQKSLLLSPNKFYKSQKFHLRTALSDIPRRYYFLYYVKEKSQIWVVGWCLLIFRYSNVRTSWNLGKENMDNDLLCNFRKCRKRLNTNAWVRQDYAYM